MTQDKDRSKGGPGDRTQVAVIGGGPGGYAAAFHAADLGLQVTLIDPEANPGGVCLYRGCIPSKALLHVAKVVTDASEATAFGVTYAPPKLDLARLRGWKDDIIAQLTGGLGQLVQRKKIRHLQGRARFLDARRLAVDLSGKTTELTFEHAILATGSLAANLPGFPPFSQRIMHSALALGIEEVPKTLLVIGGGYIGLELGSVYAALGTKVSVVEMMPGILPGVDKDLVSVLKRRLDNVFTEILTRTKVGQIKEQKNGVQAVLVDKNGNETVRRFAKALVAVGRVPNSANLGLETTQVKLDERGCVQVDAQRRTAEPSIFAIGDVAGEPMLAHKASHEGKVAAAAIAGHKSAFDPRAIPAVVYTDPEIAWCGLTQSEAQEQQRKVKVGKVPWGASGRALTLGRNTGITKIIIDPESERVLGVGIAGPGAGELIAEGTLAVEMGAVAEDLRLTIHPHPTLSETVMEAAETLFQPGT